MNRRFKRRRPPLCGRERHGADLLQPMLVSSARFDAAQISGRAGSGYSNRLKPPFRSRPRAGAIYDSRSHYQMTAMKERLDRLELAGCCLSPRSPVRPLSNALRAFHTRVAVRSGLNGRHGESKLRNTGSRASINQPAISCPVPCPATRHSSADIPIHDQGRGSPPMGATRVHVDQTSGDAKAQFRTS